MRFSAEEETKKKRERTREKRKEKKGKLCVLGFRVLGL